MACASSCKTQDHADPFHCKSCDRDITPSTCSERRSDMSSADRGPQFKNCSSSCKKGGCPSYGACLRSKGLAVTGLESTNPSFTREAQKSWDSELDAYSDAVKQGIQPASTQRKHIEAAVEVSQQLQIPFDASAPPTVVPDA